MNWRYGLVVGERYRPARTWPERWRADRAARVVSELLACPVVVLDLAGEESPQTWLDGVLYRAEVGDSR